ncbi:hypothetical protein HDU67_002212 [Dinochytrium kinnereticum]|nr:hypothetical protein HDU67_002212 [Dinochytrium kinnereticum]
MSSTVFGDSEAMASTSCIVVALDSILPPGCRTSKDVGQNDFYIQFRKIALAMKKAKRCVVVTGAGISVSAGIPDFRSEEGLYKIIKERHPTAVLRGRDLFDASLFRDKTSTKLFYEFMAKLKVMADGARATPTHLFLNQIHSRGRLARWYTQNIDCLEALEEKEKRRRPKAKVSSKSCTKTEELCPSEGDRDLASSPPGLISESSLSDEATPSIDEGPSKPSSPSKTAPILVKLHGDLGSVVCIKCSASFPFSEAYRDEFEEGSPPLCPTCLDHHMIRSAMGKRVLAVGTLRPNVVLYGEDHRRGGEIATYAMADLKKSLDLLLVIGTSLQVDGARRLVKDIAKRVKAQGGLVVLLNKTPLGKEWDEVFDYHLMGECDRVVEAIEREWTVKGAKAAKANLSPIVLDLKKKPSKRKERTKTKSKLVSKGVASVVSNKRLQGRAKIPTKKTKTKSKKTDEQSLQTPLRIDSTELPVNTVCESTKSFGNSAGFNELPYPETFALPQFSVESLIQPAQASLAETQPTTRKIIISVPIPLRKRKAAPSVSDQQTPASTKRVCIEIPTDSNTKEISTDTHETVITGLSDCNPSSTHQPALNSFFKIKKPLPTRILHQKDIDIETDPVRVQVNG